MVNLWGKDYNVNFQDVAPDATPPIGKNVLQLTEIEESANYTCVAASKLGIIERSTLVRVQGTPR